MKSKKSKTGPKPENGVLRVRLQTCGPLVRAETAAVLDAWRDSYGIPIGRSIDALIDFAKAHPEKFIIKKPKLKNECKIDVENLG